MTNPFIYYWKKVIANPPDYLDFSYVYSITVEKAFAFVNEKSVNFDFLHSLPLFLAAPCVFKPGLVEVKEKVALS